MDIQKLLRTVLLGALVLSFGAIVATADIYSSPLRGGDICVRCERVVEHAEFAGEILSARKSVAAPYRTIACMLAYLADKNIPADRIFVADRITARMTPVEPADFVRVPIAVLSDNPGYGTSEFDYVAFRSSAAAARTAEVFGTTPLSWAELRAAHAASGQVMANASH